MVGERSPADVGRGGGERDVGGPEGDGGVGEEAEWLVEEESEGCVWGGGALSDGCVDVWGCVGCVREGGMGVRVGRVEVEGTGVWKGTRKGRSMVVSWAVERYTPLLYNIL